MYPEGPIHPLLRKVEAYVDAASELLCHLKNGDPYPSIPTMRATKVGGKLTDVLDFGVYGHFRIDEIESILRIKAHTSITDSYEEPATLSVLIDLSPFWKVPFHRKCAHHT